MANKTVVATADNVFSSLRSGRPISAVPHFGVLLKIPMRIATGILVLFTLCRTAMGFFLPLTTEQRIAQATVIAVIEVKQVDDEKGRSEATVIEEVRGTKAGENIEVWDDWQQEADGSESRISGRDPYLEVGKRYLIYLTKDKRGRLVTVQSSLDCLRVEGRKVSKEEDLGSEPLADKLKRIRTILAEIQRAEQVGAGQPATRPESKLEGGDKPQPEAEGRSR